MLGSGVSIAQATQPSPDHKVTLCHRTGSVDGGNQHNGYDIITVDIASVANAKDARGHDHHNQIGNGPGGDIIPVYTYSHTTKKGVTTTYTYPGKNLGGDGQAFLGRGCHATPSETTTTTASGTTTTTASGTTTTTASGTTTTTASGTTTT